MTNVSEFLSLLLFSGHSGVVKSCRWSHSGQFLSAAGGSMVKVWSKERDSALLNIQTLHGNMSSVSADNNKV